MTRRIVAIVAGAVLAAGLVGALLRRRAGSSVADPTPAPGARTTAPAMATPTPTPTAAKTPRAARPRAWVDRGALARDIARIEARGAAGIALRPLDGGAVVQAGTARSAAAWSTMKVPVVLARLRLAE